VKEFLPMDRKLIGVDAWSSDSCATNDISDTRATNDKGDTYNIRDISITNDSGDRRQGTE